MEHSELLKNMAPCSLLCYTCGGYKEGIICRLSKELLHYTNGVYEFYEKHVYLNKEESLQQFAAFRDILHQRSQAQCDGCREGANITCSVKGCFIKDCATTHQVDFCGECPIFPCDKTKNLFKKEVYSQWLDNNRQIKEIGPYQFYEIKKKQSHYTGYLKN